MDSRGMRRAPRRRSTRLGLAALLALAGCTGVRSTEPNQTATEQLLITTAIDHAAADLNPAIPTGSKVFVDPQYFDAGTDTAPYPKYAMGAVRDELLKDGAHLVDDRKSADIVVEPRSGAQSIDRDTFLIGIPKFSVPIPLAGGVDFPEIALFKRDRQTGVAKLAVTAYGAKDGALKASAGPDYGYSERTHRVILLLFAWTETDAPPAGTEK
jgi:hypothetical protein